MTQEKTEMPELNYIGTDRYMCDVLEEMRACVKTLNFGGLLGMVEEAQALANRMEASLGAKRDIRKLNEDVHNLKQARKALEEEVKAMIRTRDALEVHHEAAKQQDQTASRKDASANEAPQE